MITTIKETEEHQRQLGYSGKPNKKTAREILYAYVSKGKTYFSYDPDALTKNFGKDRGLFNVERVRQVSRSKIFLDFTKRTIYVAFAFLKDSSAYIQLEGILEVFPEFGGFEVVEQKYEGSYDEKYKKLGTLFSLVSGAKEVSGESEEYLPGEKREIKAPTYNRYQFKIIEDVQATDWYHVTRRRFYNAIKRAGLIPSKEFQNPQDHGWTQWNFNLQNAVYLTHDVDRARKIAKAVSDKYGEDTVVLMVDGSGLEDRRKIVIDEDAIHEYEADVGMGKPDYIHSIVGAPFSIGYKGIIPSRFIQFFEKHELEQPESPYEVSEDGTEIIKYGEHWTDEPKVAKIVKPTMKPKQNVIESFIFESLNLRQILPDLEGKMQDLLKNNLPYYFVQNEWDVSEFLNSIIFNNNEDGGSWWTFDLEITPDDILRLQTSSQDVFIIYLQSEMPCNEENYLEVLETCFDDLVSKLKIEKNRRNEPEVFLPMDQLDNLVIGQNYGKITNWKRISLLKSKEQNCYAIRYEGTKANQPVKIDIIIYDRVMWLRFPGTTVEPVSQSYSDRRNLEQNSENVDVIRSRNQQVVEAFRDLLVQGEKTMKWIGVPIRAI
jgi:hypothetical protein